MWMTHHLGRNGWRPCRLRYTNTPEPRIPTVEIKSYLSSVVVAKQRCLTGATGLKIVKAGKIAILLNIQSKRQGFYAGVWPFWQIWNTTLSVQDHPNPLNSERQQSKENIIEVVGAKPRKLTGGARNSNYQVRQNHNFPENPISETRILCGCQPIFTGMDTTLSDQPQVHRNPPTLKPNSPKHPWNRFLEPEVDKKWNLFKLSRSTPGNHGQGTPPHQTSSKEAN